MVRLGRLLRNYHVQSILIGIAFALVTVGVLLVLEAKKVPHADGLWLAFVCVEFILFFLYEFYLRKDAAE